MSNDINELHPAVKRAFIELKRRLAKHGYTMGVSSTYRSIEEQNIIYAQGRTTKGPIITYAKGGDSFHNYRLAFDIFNNVRGKEYSSDFLTLAGKIGTKMGLTWGGSWVGFRDTPHFQWSDTLTLKDLKNGKYPVDKKLPWELPDEKEEKPIEPIIIPKVETIELQIDGAIYKVSRVLVDGNNYVKLRDFSQANYKIKYDDLKNLPIIEKP